MKKLLNSVLNINKYIKESNQNKVLFNITWHISCSALSKCILDNFSASDTRKEVLHLIVFPQDKYSRVMRDKAELTDRAEQLEHIVLQLQGETDTIGKTLFFPSAFGFFFIPMKPLTKLWEAYNLAKSTFTHFITKINYFPSIVVMFGELIQFRLVW